MPRYLTLTPLCRKLTDNITEAYYWYNISSSGAIYEIIDGSDPKDDPVFGWYIGTTPVLLERKCTGTPDVCV